MTRAFLLHLPPPPFAPALLGKGLSALLQGIARRHPSILVRLGAYGGADFLLDVTDVPVLLLMSPAAGRMRVFRRSAVPAHGAGIRGSLAAFLSMLHGVEDGDALFFSGALEISGDTAAVVALRNALDDAEIDLAAEIAALTHLPPPALHRVAATLGPRLGLSLHRSP